MTIRLCHPSDFKSFIEYNQDEDTFFGAAHELVSEPVKILQQGLSNIGVNATFQVSPNAGLGVFNETTGAYDGCIGQVQVNQSDVILQLFEYPLAADNLTEGIIVYDTTLAIASNFDLVTGAASQVMSSFNCFFWGIWFTIISVAMTVSLLLKLTGGIGLKKRFINEYSIFYTLTHLLRLNQMSDTGLTRKVLFISASIFSLVVVHYFLSLIKTELVVVKEPLLFDTYQDIIDRGAIPLFVKGMGYDNLFRKQGIPHSRKKLWQYASKSFREPELYVLMNTISFLVASLLVHDQNAVVILDHVMVSFIHASGCPISARDPDRMAKMINMLSDENQAIQMAKLAAIDDDDTKSLIDYSRMYARTCESMKPILFHLSIDPDERMFSQGLIFNPRLNGHLLGAIKFLARRAIECSLSNRILTSIEKSDILAKNDLANTLLGPSMKSRKQHILECKSGTIEQAHDGFHALKASNFFMLVMITGALMLFSCVILALECTVWWMHDDQPRRPTKRLTYVDRRQRIQGWTARPERM